MLPYLDLTSDAIQQLLDYIGQWNQDVLTFEILTTLGVLSPRGFALLGILLVNIISFAMPAIAYLNPTSFGGDEWHHCLRKTITPIRSRANLDTYNEAICEL
ncbi:MAG: hypothetical protein OHK0046_48420 [Anaerolineae bacterium]